MDLAIGQSFDCNISCSQSISFISTLQVYVYGESLKATLVAIVVPDPDSIVGWCKSRGIDVTYEEICGSEAAAKLILEEMNEVGRRNGLHSFELVKISNVIIPLHSILMQRSCSRKS